MGILCHDGGSGGDPRLHPEPRGGRQPPGSVATSAIVGHLMVANVKEWPRWMVGNVRVPWLDKIGGISPRD